MLINGLLYLVLFFVGLVGYLLTRHFDKQEERFYLDRGAPETIETEAVRPVVLRTVKRLDKKAG